LWYGWKRSILGVGCFFRTMVWMSHCNRVMFSASNFGQLLLQNPEEVVMILKNLVATCPIRSFKGINHSTILFITDFSITYIPFNEVGLIPLLFLSFNCLHRSLCIYLRFKAQPEFKKQIYSANKYRLTSFKPNVTHSLIQTQYLDSSPISLSIY